MVSNMSQCILSSSSTIVKIKIERDSDDVPQHTPQDLVGFPTESESTAASHGPGGIKTEPVDAALIEIKIEPHSGFENNEIKHESLELSGEGSFNSSDMKFDINEEVAVCPDLDTERAIKQEKDGKDVTSMQTSGADKLKPAAGSKTNRKQCESRRGRKARTGQGPLQCDVCQRRFKQPSVLVIHYRTHTGEKPFQCNECGRGFSRKHDLLLHLRTHIGEMGKPLQCTKCDRRFNRNKDLLIHIRTHTGEKPFQCSECDCRFSRHHGLFLHMRSHTGDKSLQCEVCERQFSQKYNLLRHMRTHTGEKPFECEVCRHRFGHKHGLLDHMRTHTGEKPYVCNVCQRAFIQKGILSKHLKTHTRDECKDKSRDKKFYVKISRGTQRT